MDHVHGGRGLAGSMASIVVYLAFTGILPTHEEAHGQIINVSALAGKPVKDGHTGTVNLALMARAGNTQILVSSANTTNFWRFGEHVLLLTAKASYGLKGGRGEWNEEPYQERIFEHLRYRRDISDWLSVEGFVQHEYDRWRRLRFRGLAGAGPRFDFDLGKSSHLGLGVAFMSQWEELLSPKAGDLHGIHQESRLSSYLSASIKLNDDAALSGSFYVQPNLARFSDVRGLVDAKITVALTKRLALRVLLALNYYTAPPAQVRGYDASTNVGFTLAL